MTKRDISDRQAVELLVNTFYEQVQKHDVLGPFFNEVAHVNWSAHLPKMYDFWEFILLGTGSYKGNVSSPHVALHAKKNLQPSDFDAWIFLFNQTVDAHFEGPKAEEIKQRASSIAGVLNYKLNGV
jgi:hemoglobin